MSGHLICQVCAGTIGYRDSHVLLKSGAVVCMSHYRRAFDRGEIADVLTREQALDRLQPSIRRPRGPETR